MDRRTFLLSTGATLASISVRPLARAFPLQAPPDGSSAHGPLLLGTDYYPDQTPESLWEEDAARMAEFGVTNVRIAEFAWSLMEPSEGKYDFAWLERAVSILRKHNIAVILGTPSAAPPPWLTQKYPEVLMVNAQGQTLSPGTRRFTCPTNATYRRLSVAIATQMAQTFASNPGVAGWQIDNELTLGESGRCYCRFCRAGFQAWLLHTYGSLEAINAAWGTAFWSNVYTDASQIPVPLPSGAPPNPGLALDYDRYQSYANVSFLGEQLTVLRKLCPNHFITTNNVSLVDTINQRDLYRDLDFVASDNYPGFFAVQSAGSGTTATPDALAPMVSFIHDFSRSLKHGKPFLIMEEQSGKAGQPTFSPQPEPGQLRLWTYQAVAHGAMGINYFRWDTATSGAEEYWHGILRHDRSPSPGFNEMKQTIQELKALGPEALHAPYPATLALLYDYSSAWAWPIQPGQPQLKYMPELAAWYGCLSASHSGIDIVGATRDLSPYKFLFAPMLYVVSPEQADRIRSFVQGGGTFVAGFRLGAKNPASQIVKTPLPGLLRDVMGVEVSDYEPIYSEKEAVRFQGVLAGSDAPVRLWADILAPQGADVLATYTSDFYAGKPAITTHAFGKGRAVYLGAHLDPADLARVLLTLLASQNVKSAFQAPRGVEIATRGSGGSAWTYLLNHTSQPQSVQIPGNSTDVVTKSPVSGSVKLDPYGVRVLRPA
jgi:beta-galactosidase